MLNSAAVGGISATTSPAGGGLFGSLSVGGTGASAAANATTPTSPAPTGGLFGSTTPGGAAATSQPTTPQPQQQAGGLLGSLQQAQQGQQQVLQHSKSSYN